MRFAIRRLVVAAAVCSTWVLVAVLRLDAGETYAFLVAVSDYDEKELRPLRFTQADILEFHDQLLSSGVKPANVIVMHDDLERLVAHYKRRGPEYKPADYLPEGRKIRAELRVLLGTLRPDDSVIVALAGHGVQFTGENKSFFCPRDTRLDDRSTLIAFEEIYEVLAASRASRRMLLVDACQNDPQTQISRSRTTVDLDSVTRPQSEAVPEGIIALFSCKSGQKSFEHPPLGHGVFFYHVLEGWKGKADANSDGRLTYHELAEYAESETALYTRLNLKAIQTPAMRSEFSGDWILRAFGTGKPITNSLGMKLVLIRPGEFLMGNPAANPQDDNPSHRVRITKPYYLGMHEVTLGDFRAFVEAEGDRTLPGVGYDSQKQFFSVDNRFNWRQTGWPRTDAHPVVNVSWNDADQFCRWLSRREGKTYRLPTEAEWELACRGGTTTTFFSGDSEDDLKGYANVADQSFKSRTAGVFKPGVYDWTKRWDDGFPFTAPVGSMKPNPFGLFDMHGNVQEWCADWYGKDYYRNSPTDDPPGPGSGEMRVKRGGDYLDYTTICPSHFRRSEVQPTSRAHFIGFRVARDAD